MIAAIVCMSANRVIGHNNQMPWHLPADLQRVKRLTTGQIILMGRKTYESIGKPLPNRRNVILTRQTNAAPAGCEVVHSIEEALQLAHGEQTLFVFGGREIYDLLLPYTEKIYMTLIHSVLEGDTFFPELDEKEWHVVQREQGVRDDKNPYDYEYVTFERSKPSARID